MLPFTQVWVWMQLLLMHAAVTGLWHNYDDKKVEKGPSADCASRFPGAQNLTLLRDKMVEWKLWPGLMSQFEHEVGESMYGFREAMEAIWENQHPADCSKARFLVAQGWPQGFGSEVHVIGVGLAVALKTKRVFVMNPEGVPVHDFLNNTWQVSNPFCRETQKRSALECYFEPWSSCTAQDALQGKTVAELHVHGKTYFSDTEYQDKFSEVEAKTSDARTVLFESRGDAPGVFPPSLDALLDCSPVIQKKYWWRAVSAAYLLRPNQRTLQLMDRHRNTVDFKSGQEQCVSIYVRRGDKHVEMKPVPLIYYLDSAKALWDAGLVPGPGGSASTDKGTIFIGSEDPDVIDEAKAWGQQRGWKILYSTLFDRREVSTGLDWIKQVKMKRKQQFKHHDLEYVSMLFNLDYHVRCSAWVCTLPSNFCRVIDEMRAAVGGKINRVYAELGIPGCPPETDKLCIQSHFLNYY